MTVADVAGAAVDESVLRKARRHSALRTSAAIGLVLTLAGAIMLVLVGRAQSRALDRDLEQVIAAAEDVDDPAPGMTLARSAAGSAPADGSARAEFTPGTSPELASRLAAALRRPPGRFEIDVPGHERMRVLVVDRPDHSRWAVAAGLDRLRHERAELVGALLLAELAGMAGAVAAAALLARRAVAPLAQALTSQRRFVADASHELRAPLTVLHTRAQMLARRSRTEPRDRLAEQLDELVADARALGEVVEDLLISAELEHRRPSSVPVDLGELAHSVVASMATYADARGVSLHMTVDGSKADGGAGNASGGAVIVSGAGSALRRALVALVDNAIGHVGTGGTVTVSVRRERRTVLVSVADDGVGLDPRDADRMFERFAHGTTGTGRRFGLGLSLVAQVAKSHRGSIRAIGAPGEGATFILAIPAAESG